jgi:OmpA-OmpF porin, OOP family
MFKRLLKASMVGAFLAAMTGAVMAQGYIGASAGRSNWDADCAGTTSCNNSGTSAKVFGGYDFSPNFAVEGALVSLGTAKATVSGLNLELKASGFEIAAVGKAPLSPNFALFGKLGLSMMNSDASVTGAATGSQSESGAGLMAGLGLSYAFTKNAALRGEFETRKVKVPGGEGNVSNFTVGVQFNF